jgi:HNH endonuclease
MLSPKMCPCGCLQPLLGGDDWQGTGFLRNHTPAKREQNVPSYKIVGTGYRTPCWIWQGVTNKWGYAKTKRFGRTMAGHRLFYLAYFGSLPKGDSSGPFRFQLDHLCRVRLCVNPEHLEPATCVQNIRRGLVPKLSPEQVAAIRLQVSDGEFQHVVASRFGISQTQVSRIVRREHWNINHEGTRKE